MPKAGDSARPSIFWAAAAGSLVFFVVNLLASVGYTLGLLDAGLPSVTLLVLVRPVIEALLAGLAFFLGVWQSRRGSRAAGLLVLVAMLVPLAAHAYSPWEGMLAEPLVLPGAAIACGLLLRPLATGLFGRFRFGQLVFWPAVGAFLLATATLNWSGDIVAVNGYGLASFRPSSTDSRDYSGYLNKDDYPVCYYTYNSLGYRDIEPDPKSAAARRVLLVGDSFVWGDGIAQNDDTLDYMLRAELAKLAPGRFSTTSAAFPGLNLYGYMRAATTLQEPLGITDVVIGYLGTADHGIIGAQSLVDAYPDWDLLVQIYLALGVRRQLHEAASSLAPLWSGAAADDFATRSLEQLSDHAREHGYRVTVLSYAGTPPPYSEGMRVIELPEDLRYPGHSSELWYAKDFHPKPPLNRRIALLLAEALQ